MPGETRRAVYAQPEWLRALPAVPRLPDGARVAFTGCGTSFHAAQTGRGVAVQALEAVLAPPDADVLVCVSHEGETAVTLEAARAFRGAVWLVTGKAESPLADLAEEVVVATPEVERSWCHTASYTCAVAAVRAMAGEDVSWLADAVDEALHVRHMDMDIHGRRRDMDSHGQVMVVGAGEAWPTAQEAALKLREGAHVHGQPWHTEQLLHGHLAAVDGSETAYVLEGQGRAADRARDAVCALETLGVDTTLLPTRHPVVDIVFFHLLTLALADARRVDPDPIRREPGSPWAEAAGSAYPRG